jgi:hypothetical protein
MEAGKRQAVATIALESERLLHLATASGNDFIAGLIRIVLDEARATLMGRGTKPGASDASPSVAQFKPTKPTKPRRLN